jgi:CheY-like chemotaxis protein
MAPQPPVTILVIDDASAFVSALAMLLRRDGYTVLTARNGNIALALLQERRYDVILCDVQMPGLDGPTFADILRSQYPYLRQRVIFLMADALNAESLVFLKQCGQPWLYKPCTIVAIRSAIAQVLRAAVPAHAGPAAG